VITWKKGSLFGGAGEIEEVKGAIQVLKDSQFFSQQEMFSGGNTFSSQGNDEIVRYVESQYRRAKMQTLYDFNWRKMANTGSYWDYNNSEITTFQQLFRNLQQDGERRNISRIFKQFVGEGETNDFNGRVECPIVLNLKVSGGIMQDGRFMGPYYLVGGNTRLTVAKALRIRPNIMVCDVDF
jgi:hypothetical protein